MRFPSYRESTLKVYSQESQTTSIVITRPFPVDNASLKTTAMELYQSRFQSAVRRH